MPNSDANAIIERVKLLRQQYAGARGKSEFARSLGISPSTYSYYEKNRIPPIELLLKISEVTGADLHWLLTGDQGSQKDSQRGQPAVKIPKILLEKIQNLLSDDPGLLEPVSAFIELLNQKKGLESRTKQGGEPQPGRQTSRSIPDVQENRQGWIPVIGRTAAGIVHFWNEELMTAQAAVTELDQLVKKYTGKEIVGLLDGRATVDLHLKPLADGLKKADISLVQISGSATGRTEEIVEFVQCEQIYRIFNDSFALRVDGDSMSPRINDGDIVILSPSMPAAQGQISVVRLANQIGVTCKIIRNTDDSVHLIPINEKYETKVMAKKDVLWSLAVLCHISF
jgi:SOS-response transcriptional repressor LexA/DNA-binding XRE family transcriptional regulator